MLLTEVWPSSLLEEVTSAGIDRFSASAYDTLARIPDYKITKVDDLLPWRWNG